MDINLLRNGVGYQNPIMGKNNKVGNYGSLEDDDEKTDETVLGHHDVVHHSRGLVNFGEGLQLFNQGFVQNTNEITDAKFKDYNVSKHSKIPPESEATPDASEIGSHVGDEIDKRLTGGKGLAEISPDFLKRRSDLPALAIASCRTLLQYFSGLAKEDMDAKINFQFVHGLLANGAPLDCCDVHGQTVIHEAARIWHTDVMKFLLEQSAYGEGENKAYQFVNVTDNFGRTPLHIAATVDYGEMCRFLIETGKADKEARTKGEEQTAAHYAAKYDAGNALRVLIELGCKYKWVRDYRNRTPIHIASELDRSETARILLKNNAPVGVRDDTGQSTITWMISKMAPVGLEAMDQFHICDRANRKQYFYLNHLGPPPKELLDKIDEKNSKEKDSKEKDKKGMSICAKTTLEVIVDMKQYDVLMHPAVQKFLNVKWRAFGLVGALFYLFLDLVYVSTWTAVAVGTNWQSDVAFSTWQIVLYSFSILFTFVNIIAEIFEFFKSRNSDQKYKRWLLDQLERDMKFCHPQFPDEMSFLEKEKENLEDMKSSYFTDIWWNIMDWFVYISLIVCVFINMFERYVQHNVEARIAHLRLLSIAIIFLWLRLMKRARAFSFVGPFIVMVCNMIVDVVQFGYLFLQFLIPFLCAYWMIWGGYKYADRDIGNVNATLTSVNGMENPWDTFMTLFSMTIGQDYPGDDMKNIDPVMYYIYTIVWFSLSNVFLLNLFIALLSNTFQNIYDNAKAVANMQKAITILQVQEAFPERYREYFNDQIRKMCPLDMYYDDDDSSGERDVQRLTVMIMEHLENERDRERVMTDKIITGINVLEKSIEHGKEFLREAGEATDRSGGGGSNEKLVAEIEDLKTSVSSLKKNQQKLMKSQSQEMGEIKEMLKELLLKKELTLPLQPTEAEDIEEKRPKPRRKKKKSAKPPFEETEPPYDLPGIPQPDPTLFTFGGDDEP